MEPKLPIVHLKPGRDKKIRGFYPWVQREEVAGAEPCEPGAPAALYSSEREFLAVGTYNPQSRFPFRVFSLEQRPLDAEFFRSRFDECLASRAAFDPAAGRRLAFSEVDGLPGLILDQFGSYGVVQVRSLGMERLKPVWLPELISRIAPEAVYERSDMEGRREEGLEPFAGILYGELPPSIEIVEDGMRRTVLVESGAKTGYYLDQRDSRRRLAERIQPGERVLDAFCYTGGFSLAAASRGAQSLGLDLSDQALSAARSDADRNGIADRCSFEEANVFDWLAQKPAMLFDWIVLDPPALAKSREKRDSLKWGVWKLVYHALDHLKPGGRMAVCSCSYQLPLDELLATIRLAASDRGKRAFLEEVTLQAGDHPHLLHFPESLYLKCAWVRIP